MPRLPTHQLQDACGDDGLAAGGGVGKRAVALRVFEHYSVKLCSRHGQRRGEEANQTC